MLMHNLLFCGSKVNPDQQSSRWQLKSDRILRLASALMAVVCALSLSLVGKAQTPPAAVKPIPGPGSTYAQQPLATVPHSPALPYGLQLLAHFELLPIFRDTRCFQDASYDPSGGNGDAGHYFRQEGNRSILCDIKGPGCVYRFWSANAAGHLKIFFDGETTPRIDCPMQDLFLGKVAPFVAPLVGHKSGGWYCYFPMPFAKRCRMEVTDPGSMYYHVQYQRFPDNRAVATFTRQLSQSDEKALGMVLAQWSSNGENPITAWTPALPDYRSSTKSIGSVVSLPAGQTRLLGNLVGPGVVKALRLALVPADRVTLRQTLLRVYWDGATKPAIEAPVGDFFGVGFGDHRVRSQPMAMLESGYQCFWPMPFARSARFELVNLSKIDLSAVAYGIESQHLATPLADAGYFHAQWHRETTVSGQHFHILEVKGRGHYVGEHTDMQGDRGIGFLEGDEKFYVDGETFPSIHGTGTEDFYTGGWYFDEGPFNLPFHGCTVKEDLISRVSAYRYQITDCVPFQHDLKVDIEHGGTNDYPGADYSCVAYWYQDKPAHDWSPIKPDQLNPSHPHAENAKEAESLTWSGGKSVVMTDDSLPIEASGGKLVVLSGEKVTTSLPVTANDNYTLHLNALNLPDGAKSVVVRINGGAPVTTVLNGTGNRIDGTVFVPLKPGSHSVAIDVPDAGHIYLDYLRLEPSKREKGVVEAESLLDTLDAVTKAESKLVDPDPIYSAGGALRWQPAGTNRSLGLPVTVDREGDYTLELAVNAEGSSPEWRLRTASGETQTTHFNGTKGLQRLRFSGLMHLKPGKQTLALVPLAPGATLTLDWFRLVRTRYPNSFEGEGLKVLANRDGSYDTQDMKGFGPNWSGDAQLWFHATKEGAEITLELPVATSGAYTLAVYLTTAKDYGIVQTLVDDKLIGKPIDCFTQDVRPTGRVELGSLELSAGMHRITFRSAGKNAASTNFLIGIDAIGLEPAKR